MLLTGCPISLAGGMILVLEYLLMSAHTMEKQQMSGKMLTPWQGAAETPETCARERRVVR